MICSVEAYVGAANCLFGQEVALNRDLVWNCPFGQVPPGGAPSTIQADQKIAANPARESCSAAGFVEEHELAALENGRRPGGAVPAWADQRTGQFMCC